MDYKPALSLLETEIAIKYIKDSFEKELAKALKLTRVSAPLFVFPETGLNDNLNGIERAVRFDVLDLGKEVEIVQSLAKWKRMALAKYGFETDKGFDCTKPMLISERVSASCADMFGRFVDESFNSDGMDLRSKGLFYLLWDSILCQNRSHRSDTDKLIDKVKSLLKKSEDIPISRIARECSVSVSGLRRSFTELVGMSPMQYRLKEKFKRARYLLEATDMSVGEISDCLNFYDAAYFCRAFRKETGISPREYRKNKKL